MRASDPRFGRPVRYGLTSVVSVVYGGLLTCPANLQAGRRDAPEHLSKWKWRHHGFQSDSGRSSGIRRGSGSAVLLREIADLGWVWLFFVDAEQGLLGPLGASGGGTRETLSDASASVVREMARGGAVRVLSGCCPAVTITTRSAHRWACEHAAAPRFVGVPARIKIVTGL